MISTALRLSEWRRITFGPLVSPKNGSSDKLVWGARTVLEAYWQQTICPHINIQILMWCVGLQLDVLGLSYVAVINKRKGCSKRKRRSAMIPTPFCRICPWWCNYGGMEQLNTGTVCRRSRFDIECWWWNLGVQAGREADAWCIRGQEGHL